MRTRFSACGVGDEPQNKESLIYAWDGIVAGREAKNVFVLSKEGAGGNLDLEKKPMSYEALGAITGNCSTGPAACKCSVTTVGRPMGSRL
jgi:hypothetical protein